MLADGIRLMAVGMITVFGFLTVLVAVMAAQAAFFSAFSGRFADEWDAERDAGYPKLEALKEAHAGPGMVAMEQDLRRRLGPDAGKG